MANDQLYNIMANDQLYNLANDQFTVHTYFGLNGDDPRTSFGKSLIASAATIAALMAIASGTVQRNILFYQITDCKEPIKKV